MSRCSWIGFAWVVALCGAWASSLALAAEDPAAEIRASAEIFAKTFDQGNAKELAALFAESGELIDEEGTVYRGRDELADMLGKFFAKFPGATLAIEIESIRSLGPNLAIEEGTRQITTKDGTARAAFRYSAVKTKVGKQWLIASVRETNDDPSPTPNEKLQTLAWLVGDWVNEGSDAVVRISYRWSDDKNYLLGDYSVLVEGKPGMKSTQRIGWDPVTQKARSWLFDADGGFSEGQWTPVAEGWIVKSNTVNADGRTGSATLKFTPKGKDHFLLTGKDRLVGDEQAPDFEVTVARKPAVAKPIAPSAVPGVKKGN